MPGLTLETIHPKIELLANRVFEAAGVELIELKLAGHKNDMHIQITADKSSGGITIRECAILNKALVALIAQENLLPPEIFSLELSSPGLDRPLVTRKDFMRLKSKKLHFWLNLPIEGKKEAQGTLIDVTESGLTINTLGNHKLFLTLSAIIKGMLVIE